MVLDGVVDPTVWVLYKVTFNTAATETTSHLLRQLSSQLLVDTEKTYSGLTDGCAKAGRASCKLIEITGDNASGDDVKTLLSYAFDVSLIHFLDRVIQLTFFSILGHPRAVS